MKYWKNTNRYSNLTYGSFVTDLFTNREKNKLYLVFVAIRILILQYASKRPLHSGHYGNWAPNPALMLAKLLATMKDENGRVTIKGFYDDVIPLTASEQKALQEVPSVDVQMKKELGLSQSEMSGTSLSEAINLPSLNINGM